MTISGLWNQAWRGAFTWLFCLSLIIVLATNKFSGWLLLKSEKQISKLQVGWES